MAHPVAEDDLEAAAEYVRNMRVRVAALGAVRLQDFKWAPLGSEHTMIHHGVAVDHYVAHASTKDAKDFCRNYHLNVQFGCTRKYGEANYSTLLNAWCHRMQWLLDTMQASGERNFAFTDAILATYVERPDFVMWANGFPNTSAIAARVRQLRAIRPGLRLH